jgi:uncharacterized protein (DUF4415 family)
MPDSDQDPRSPTTVRIRSSVLKRLRHAAIEEGTDQQDIVEEALKEWLTKHGH